MSAKAPHKIAESSDHRLEPPTKVARHLVSTPHELAVTQFEQGLICAAEAFYRFYGVLLGREGRRHNLSGQDNVILQQIMAASRPLGVADIARFANRDDIANIQYSLKKLSRAGLIEKARNSSVRETSYLATDLAKAWTRDFLALRRELFTDPSAQILNFDEQLGISAKLLNVIAGFYDHGTRVMSGSEQTGEPLVDKPQRDHSQMGRLHNSGKRPPPVPSPPRSRGGRDAISAAHLPPPATLGLVPRGSGGEGTGGGRFDQGDGQNQVPQSSKKRLSSARK